MKTILTFLVLFLVAGFATGCAGRPSGPIYRATTQYNPQLSSLTTGTAKKNIEQYSDNLEKEEFDTKSIKSFSSIFKKIKYNFPPKDQFETSEQYSNRCNEAGSDVYVIKLDLADGSKKVHFSYDADKNIATIKIRTSSITGSSSVQVSGSGKNYKQKGEYIGANVFGVTKKVKVLDIYSEHLIVPYGQTKGDSLTMKLSCNQDEARELANNYEVAVIFIAQCGAKINGIAATDKQYSGATVDVPVSGTFYNNIISAKLRSIVVYDGKTKKRVITRNFTSAQ